MGPIVAIWSWCGNYIFLACNLTGTYLHLADPAILHVNDGASQKSLPEVQVRRGAGRTGCCPGEQEEEEKRHGRQPGYASACEDPQSGAVSTLAARPA